MITERNIIRIGKSSLAIVLPREFIDEYKIKKSDVVQLNIIFVDKLDSGPKHYKCMICLHQFDMEDDVPYCPVCGEEKIQIMSDEVEE